VVKSSLSFSVPPVVFRHFRVKIPGYALVLDAVLLRHPAGAKIMSIL
jgi:hypothetical protein